MKDHPVEKALSVGAFYSEKIQEINMAEVKVSLLESLIRGINGHPGEMDISPSIQTYI